MKRAKRSKKTSGPSEHKPVVLTGNTRSIPLAVITRKQDKSERKAHIKVLKQQRARQASLEYIRHDSDSHCMCSECNYIRNRDMFSARLRRKAKAKQLRQQAIKELLTLALIKGKALNARQLRKLARLMLRSIEQVAHVFGARITKPKPRSERNPFNIATWENTPQQYDWRLKLRVSNPPTMNYDIDGAVTGEQVGYQNSLAYHDNVLIAQRGKATRKLTARPARRAKDTRSLAEIDLDNWLSDMWESITGQRSKRAYKEMIARRIERTGYSASVWQAIEASGFTEVYYSLMTSEQLLHHSLCSQASNQYNCSLACDRKQEKLHRLTPSFGK